MVLRGHPFDLHLAEPLTLTTIFWVLATGPSSVLSYHSVRENPLFLCKKNVEELKKRKDAFKSRSCLQEHSKETFFNPGQHNKCFLMWHWKFIPCCVFDMIDYYEALFQSDLLSLEVGLEQVCSHLLVPSNLQMKKTPFLESGLATDLSREQRRACDGDSRPGNFDFKCGLKFLEVALNIEPLLLQWWLKNFHHQIALWYLEWEITTFCNKQE